MSGKFNINDVREVFVEQIIDYNTQLGGFEAAVSLGDISPLLNGGQDGGIGAGTPDAPLF
jgi:hypothetical protein